MFKHLIFGSPPLTKLGELQVFTSFWIFLGVRWCKYLMVNCTVDYPRLGPPAACPIAVLQEIRMPIAGSKDFGRKSLLETRPGAWCGGEYSSLRR